MEKNMKYVIFDFDGTLTTGDSNVWVNIWKNLDLPEKYQKLDKILFDKHKNGEITYEKWVEYANRIFIAGGMNREKLEHVCGNVSAVAGVTQTLKALKQNGYGVFIVSGGIKQAIEVILGDDCKFFDGIFANDMWFRDDGKLLFIKATNFDHKGKADFVNKLIRERHIKPTDVTFVGNGLNDELVYTTGCKTVCVNPEPEAHYNDKKIWNYFIPNFNNLTQIFNHIEVDELNK